MTCTVTDPFLASPAYATETLGGLDGLPHECQGESELRALMSMAAHDLKNPLSSVSSHIEMLRADYGEQGADFHRDLAAIERGLRRMSRLTEQLLDYARAGHVLQLSRTPLDDIVREVVTDHISTSAAQVTVIGTLPTVVADTTLIVHVLDNLIGNAIKYTPSNAAPEIEVNARDLPDGAIRIEVSDRGIGIPAAEQPNIFDAFHRCRNSSGYAGTGLGLNICRRIVERHGGQIGVEDNPGGGSRFWFTLALPDQAGGCDE